MLYVGAAFAIIAAFIVAYLWLYALVFLFTGERISLPHSWRPRQWRRRGM